MAMRKYDSRPTVIVALPVTVPMPAPHPDIVEALRHAGYSVERRFGLTYVVIPIDRVAAVTVLNTVEGGVQP